MTKLIQTFGLTLVLSLFSVGIATGYLQNLEAYGDSSEDSETVCRSGQVLVYHFNFRKYICTSESGAAQWVKHGIAELVSSTTAKDTEAKMEPKAEAKMEPKAEAKMEPKMAEEKAPASVATEVPEHKIKIKSGTLTSEKDPGIGHELHQLVIILPPSDKVYKGALTYSASEPIQLVTLHGPIKKDNDRGQPTWTTDGETKFGLTFIDNKDSSGTWQFSGNALAVHTMKDTPFTVTFSLRYVEVPMSSTIKTGSLHSTQDPGIGHETHQLAILLPPRDNPYTGVVSYSASEPIQLVALHGPLKPGEDMGQPTWTPDGTTKFALTFVDKGKASGVWQFTGNALAFHTMNETPFTVTYSVLAE